MIPMTDEQKKTWAIRQLQHKAQELGRPPIKADFDDATRARIKAFLGPWPKALEAAGLKNQRRKVIEMNEKLLKLARAEGFYAAIIPAQDVPVDPKFRAFCEQNLCGQYNANYSCPPDCGTVEELHRNILAQDKALVISTIWEIESFDDKCAVRHAKETHNAAVLRLMDKLREIGCVGFCTGYNGCPLCDPCKRKENLPCAHPDKRISCMSAYCIDVAKLAEKCGLEFGWIPGKLFLFGMIAYHEEK